MSHYIPTVSDCIPFCAWLIFIFWLNCKNFTNLQMVIWHIISNCNNFTYLIISPTYKFHHLPTYHWRLAVTTTPSAKICPIPSFHHLRRWQGRPWHLVRRHLWLQRWATETPGITWFVIIIIIITSVILWHSIIYICRYVYGIYKSAIWICVDYYGHMLISLYRIHGVDQLSVGLTLVEAGKAAAMMISRAEKVVPRSPRSDESGCPKLQTSRFCPWKVGSFYHLTNIQQNDVVIQRNKMIQYGCW